MEGCSKTRAGMRNEREIACKAGALETTLRELLLV